MRFDHTLVTDLGANDLIYFKTRTLPYPDNPPGSNLTGVEVSGIAIQRK